MKPEDHEKTFPGEELIEEGLSDLAQDRLTEASLLLLIAGPRLRSLGVPIKELPCPQPYEHELYSRLEDRLGSAAHSYYNSLLRRIVSYTHALEHLQAER
jgi:hypothetical protein